MTLIYDTKVKSHKHVYATQNPRLKIKQNACTKWEKIRTPQSSTSECNKCDLTNDKNNKQLYHRKIERSKISL